MNIQYTVSYDVVRKDQNIYCKAFIYIILPKIEKHHKILFSDKSLNFTFTVITNNLPIKTYYAGNWLELSIMVKEYLDELQNKLNCIFNKNRQYFNIPDNKIGSITIQES